MMIAHIVPTVPPAFNGLSDYCFSLSHNWPDKSESWGCLALTVPRGAKEIWPQATLVEFEPSGKSLSDALQPLRVDTLIVHYVGYAYHPKGIPAWLPPALTKWKKRCPNAHLSVMFHELWAGGPPWRSCFWVMPKAKSIVADLACLSDSWTTSCQYYFDKVVEVGGNGARGSVIPIATGIEPRGAINFDRIWPLSETQRLKIVVFGLTSTRNSALAFHTELLRVLLKLDLVENLLLLGQSPQNEKERIQEAELVAQIGGPCWQRAYDLAPDAVSHWLQGQDLGLVKENAKLLTKSSVFAALCMHGVLPVCAGFEDSREENAAFFVNFEAATCARQLQDKTLVETKKRNLESLAKSSLGWASVAQKWSEHLREQQ